MDVLLTLPLGLTLQLLMFFVLWRGLRMAAKAAALIVGLLALALYVPYAILAWPGADVLALHLAVFLVAAYALGLITGYRETQSGAGGFHWGPTLIIAFFVVLILFDAVLVVIATRGLPEPLARMFLPDTTERAVSSAFPGVVANDFQKKEALYNAYLEQVRAQQARGWAVRKGWVGDVHAGEPALFQVTVEDRNGAAVAGADVRGRFLRASDTRLDREIVLAEVKPGVYQGEVTLPVHGAWELMLEIRRGEDRHEIRATTAVVQ
ncbi:MAG TPA: FixH family protein [Gammaproteobacteria bacterium]